MKTALIIGFGKMARGLIGPVFKQADYAVTVAVKEYQKGAPECSPQYVLRTPQSSTTIMLDDVIPLEDVTNRFDLIITSVGRQNVPAVAEWYKQKKLSAPVALAENLPDPSLANLFPEHIPIVIDRICPRMTIENAMVVAFAEDFYSIGILDRPLTHGLGVVPNIALLTSTDEVERRRKQKMFTVNTAHLLTVVYGRELGCLTVDQAMVKPAVSGVVRAVILEVAPWLGLSNDEAAGRAEEIIRRLSAPLNDPLARILKPETYGSAVQYLEEPLKGLQAMGLSAPALTAAMHHLRENTK